MSETKGYIIRGAMFFGDFIVEKDGYVHGYCTTFAEAKEKISELERIDELLAREYPVELRKLPDDDCWIAWYPDFGWSTCSAVEDTPQAALKLLNKVRIDVIQHFIDTGKEIPEPSKKGTNETPHPVPSSKDW